jgi:hypothetical protein
LYKRKYVSELLTLWHAYIFFAYAYTYRKGLGSLAFPSCAEQRRHLASSRPPTDSDLVDVDVWAIAAWTAPNSRIFIPCGALSWVDDVVRVVENSSRLSYVVDSDKHPTGRCGCWWWWWCPDLLLHTLHRDFLT